MNYESRSIDIDDIEVVDRLRALQPEKVAALAASMAEIGLRTPISVRILDSMVIAGEKVLEVPVLVAGAHRLAAAKMLAARDGEKWQRIDCVLVPADDSDAILWEIDENLCRAELSPAQVSGHMARRKAVWEERQAKEAGGTGCPTSLSDGRKAGPQHQLAFAADAAAKTGRSKRSINRAVARAEKIAPDVRQAVVGTKLDTGASLDRLAKLTHEEQRTAIADGEARDKFRKTLWERANPGLARALRPVAAAQTELAQEPGEPAKSPAAAQPAKARPQDDEDVIDLVQILHGNLNNALLKETAAIARRIGDRFTIAEVFVAADEGDWEEPAGEAAA